MTPTQYCLFNVKDVPATGRTENAMLIQLCIPERTFESLFACYHVGVRQHEATAD